MDKSEGEGLSENVLTFDKADFPATIQVCPFCVEKEAVPAWREIIHHCVITVDKGNHCHVHGPLDDKATLKRMAETLFQMAK